MLLLRKWTLHFGRLHLLQISMLFGVHKPGVIWNYIYERRYKQQKASTCTSQYVFALASRSPH